MNPAGQDDARGVFVSWVRSHGRSHDLAAALGLREVNYPPSVVTLPRAARYLAAALATTWTLVRTRPRVVVVMSPPPLPVLIAAAYCLVTRRPLVVDAHSGAFNRPAWRGLSRVSLQLAQRCQRSAVVVTNQEMRQEAESWVRLPVIELHDLLAPVALPADVAPSCDVFFISTWADDEPLSTLVTAMNQLGDLRVVISGRPPSEAAQRELEAAGVVVPGYLSEAEYHRTFGGAGVVVALTTRDGTMQRGGYEAASAGKALVTSDTRVLRDYFGEAAVYSVDDADALVAAVRAALARRDELEVAVRALRGRVLAAQDVGLQRLADVLGVPLLRG